MAYDLEVVRAELLERLPAEATLVQLRDNGRLIVLQVSCSKGFGGVPAALEEAIETIFQKHSVDREFHVVLTSIWKPAPV